MLYYTKKESQRKDAAQTGPNSNLQLLSSSVLAARPPMLNMTRQTKSTHWLLESLEEREGGCENACDEKKKKKKNKNKKKN